MRKLQYISSLLLLVSVSYAGTISHNDYVAGAVITAAGQNTNENVIVNEINGNLDANNLAANAVTTVKITDANVTLAKLATIVQSTFTFVNSLPLYRRPNLVFIGVATVDIEANTGTSNETCITFIDEQRCVTENTGSTSQYRRLIVTETASMTGTHNSGLLSGETLTANSWLAVYAVKTSDNSSKYVLVCSTNAPLQANYSTLNTKLGAGSWTYMGVLRYGDDAGATTSIMRFNQVGPQFRFTSVVTSNFTKQIGIVLTGTTGIVSSTYTFSGGMVGTNVIPTYFKLVTWGIYRASDSTFQNIQDASGTLFYSVYVAVTGSAHVMFIENADVSLGIAQAGGSSITREETLVGWIDPILMGASAAPRL